MQAWLWWGACLCALATTTATLSKSDKKKSKADSTTLPWKGKALSGAQSLSVLDKDLVSEELLASDVLEHHAAFCKETCTKRFTSAPVLGYVTPWNGHGYDVAKTFAPKLDMVSPVWLQLLPKSQGQSFSIAGTHDVDPGWVQDVKSKSKSTATKILPRVLFERFTGQDYVSLFRSESERKEVSRIIRESVSEYNFDGIVLELWTQLGGQAREEISEVIAEIARELHRSRKILVLAVPPPFHTWTASDGGLFSKADFDRLRISVDFFSLMTYDFSSVQRPGPNAPLSWMKACVEALDPKAVARQQILLGLNLYGLKHTSSGGGHVLGRDLVDILKSVAHNTKFAWDPKSSEHFLEAKVSGQKITVFYPSLASLQERIQLAEELGTGLSMWELGQGLDYFYDLF